MIFKKIQYTLQVFKEDLELVLCFYYLNNMKNKIMFVEKEEPNQEEAINVFNQDNNTESVGKMNDEAEDDMEEENQGQDKVSFEQLENIQASVHSCQESDIDSLTSNEVSQEAVLLPYESRIMIRKEVMRFLCISASQESLFWDKIIEDSPKDNENVDFECNSKSSLSKEYAKLSNGTKFLAKTTMFRYMNNARNIICAENEDEYYDNISLQPKEMINSMYANADNDIKSKSVSINNTSHLLFDKATSINSYFQQSREKNVDMVIYISDRNR